MNRILLAVVLGEFALGQFGQVAARAQTAALGLPDSSVKSDSPGKNLADVPPLPGGKSTILGGKIANIDQVRDQFVLRVYGEKPMKILYDERTQLFKDGNKIPLRQLGPAEHASVQTTLDGSKIFALSVHILSATPTGDFEGRVLDYDQGSGALTLIGQGTNAQFRVRVTSETKVSREGQETFTAANGGHNDLTPGALVSLNFESDNRGQGIAQQITILATPGAVFVFSGTVSSMNIAGGYLMVLDPRDQRSYQIHFNPQDPVVLRLHQGDHVRIEANYDGTRYAATRITAP